MKLRAFSGSVLTDKPAVSGSIRECLIVDDDELTRTVLACQLGSLGVTVRQAGEARQALSIWSEWRPAAVLIDCVMPGQDGYVLARRIRQIERGIRPAVSTLLIGVSGHTGRSHVARCEGVGMDAVLGKPASTQTFAAMLGLTQLTQTVPQPHADDDAARARELQYLYVSSCESDLQLIEQGLRQWRAQGVSFHAHRIEGASRVVGANDVAAAARALYDAVAQGRTMPVLQASCARLSSAFAAWRRAPHAPAAAGIAPRAGALVYESAV